MNKRVPDTRLTVFYDGACPLCRREIDFYRRRRGAEAVEWLDISIDGNEYVERGLTRCDALRRFHVKLGDGSLLSGAAAFAALWRALPNFRWLGKFASVPPVLWSLEHAYRFFLKIRPTLQKGLAA